ncbi:MAG: hypothetical protein IPK75_04200 [Acidobacteria bacterium]|nr:hypothetical protein [Acidobacteriota bacterium]
MKRSLISFTVLLSLAAPGFADACDAATEAATRAALQSAEAAGRRTATVRVSCDGERKTYVLRRSTTASGASVTVREITRGAGQDGLAGAAASDSSTARIIRVGQ